MNKSRDLTDWLLFGAVSVLWAGAYALTRGATFGENGLPVGLIVPGRLIIGAVILNMVVFATGRRYPPLSDRKRWAVMLGMGLFGMTGPFFLITIAQKTVDSSLAALYVAAVPIFVALGANFMFKDEKLTMRISLGIGVGFLGVIALFGPDAYENFGSASTIAQLLLLIAAVLYASSTLLARAAPKIESLIFAAGFVTLAAIMSLPMLVMVDWQTLKLTPVPVLSVIGLGIGPSAFASILYMMIVQRAGATFLALTGYLVPILSAILGFIIFHEVQSWNALIAFALILSGVWLAQGRSKAKN
jgi:drug/metabolite transporter (DMT)-like permease